MKKEKVWTPPAFILSFHRNSTSCLLWWNMNYWRNRFWSVDLLTRFLCELHVKHLDRFIFVQSSSDLFIWNVKFVRECDGGGTDGGGIDRGGADGGGVERGGADGGGADGGGADRVVCPCFIFLLFCVFLNVCWRHEVVSDDSCSSQVNSNICVVG